MINIKTSMDGLETLHNKSIESFTETWLDDKKSIELTITFSDGSKLKLEPYIDKNAKFESSRNDLRLKYKIK